MAKVEYVWQDRRHFMWFPLLGTKYWISNGRLYCCHGLLHRDEHECMLYRILDISMKRSLPNLLFGTGDIILKTNDGSDPLLTLDNVKHPSKVKELISNMVEEARDTSGLKKREIRATSGNFEDANGDGTIDGDDLT